MTIWNSRPLLLNGHLNDHSQVRVDEWLEKVPRRLRPNSAPTAPGTVKCNNGYYRPEPSSFKGCLTIYRNSIGPAVNRELFDAGAASEGAGGAKNQPYAVVIFTLFGP